MEAPLFNIFAAARAVFSRKPRPSYDREYGMREYSTYATLRRHWIDPLDRE